MILQDAQMLDGWRSIVVALLGVLVALIAVVYRDLSRRLHNLEAAAREDFVPRKEYERTHNDLLQHIDQRLTRIEMAMDRRRKGE